MALEYKNRPRDEAVEQIECYIIENDLKPHDRLPSERDMCAMWDINRTTLRSAITRLRDEGVLYNKIGSGTYIAPKKLVRNLQDLKGFNDFALDEGRNPATKLLCCQIREANKKIAKSLRLPLGHHILEVGRVRYIDGNPVMLEHSFWDAERFEGLETYDFEIESIYAILARDYGVVLERGREKLNVTYVGADEAELLEMEESAPVIYQSGVVSDDSGTPVEYFRLIARSEYIQFASMLMR